MDNTQNEIAFDDTGLVPFGGIITLREPVVMADGRMYSSIYCPTWLLRVSDGFSPTWTFSDVTECNAIYRRANIIISVRAENVIGFFATPFLPQRFPKNPELLYDMTVYFKQLERYIKAAHEQAEKEQEAQEEGGKGKSALVKKTTRG